MDVGSLDFALGILTGVVAAYGVVLIAWYTR